MIGEPVERRRFNSPIVVVTMDPLWTAPRAAATAPVIAGRAFRGYIRIATGEGFRYGFVAGRGHWDDVHGPVSDGLLFEVSPRHRIDPRSYPSDGSRFREIGEVAVANDPALFDTLRAGFGN